MMDFKSVALGGVYLAVACQGANEVGRVQTTQLPFTAAFLKLSESRDKLLVSSFFNKIAPPFASQPDGVYALPLGYKGLVSGNASTLVVTAWPNHVEEDHSVFTEGGHGIESYSVGGGFIQLKGNGASLPMSRTA
jgi:hypothetical protein